MLKVEHLTKAYGKKKAVADISFTVDKGEILGFLGPNGAGKSTTMNIITGYTASTSGEVLVDGMSILADPLKAKAKIGYLPEKPPLYMDMTVKEYLNFVYELKKVKLPRAEHIAEVCELVKITDVYERVIGHLSKGYCQRVGIAQALLGNPELLILDEPTVGLDPKQIIEIRDLIKTLGKTQTIILSSHILPEVQAICSRIIVVSKGRLVADGAPDDLARLMSGDRKLAVRVEGPENKVYELLRSVDGMQTVTKMGERETGVFEFILDSKEDADVRRRVFFDLAQKGWPLMASRSCDMSLEEIFLSLTSGNGTAQEEALTLEDAVATEPVSDDAGEPVNDNEQKEVDADAGNH
ncbi:MAG: ATP-binding cassette domain-containing protein [Angelakisella sp.]